MPSEEQGWWFEDECGSAARLGLLASRVHARKTRFQKIEVLAHPKLGRVLVLDNILQTTTSDEFIYHEMIAHVPILGRAAAAASAACTVLIIGGGDGGTLREVLRHPFVARVVMVEIDGEVIEVCKEHLGIHGDFDDPRLELIIGDGVEYTASTDARTAFDVVLVDSSDPLGGPADPLFTADFTRSLRSCLKPGGVVVRQYGVPLLEGSKLADGVRQMRANFKTVQVYRVCVPSYIGGETAFLLGTDAEGCERCHRQHQGRWYTPAVHAAAFALPPLWDAMVTGRPAASG
ncbi:MAG: polyamine aminopropyltransferase [Planctomycetota bacterium]|jgi:spermidine synthase